ncbi:glycosyltransferase family 9 protein [Singulisphaera sp. PoT]|uniref:glycosyltransferase family 9 protein n=1 Tax=Singulisphaera sp. PoT TaxID=3411797 RepID=UPI003BF4EE7F
MTSSTLGSSGCSAEFRTDDANAWKVNGPAPDEAPKTVANAKKRCSAVSGSREDLLRLNPARICIIKPSALGDVVHALPVLNALRSRWPTARLSWVVNRGLTGLVEGHPDLDEVIPFDREQLRPTPGGIAVTARFLAGLRKRRFDLTVDLQGLLRTGIMTAATGAPVRIGLADAREGATRFYTHRVSTEPDAVHAVDRLLAVSEALGAETDEPRFVVAATEADRLWARLTLASVPGPRLVLNLGARWLTKRWPPEHFAAIGRKAVDELGAGLIVVGAPEDRPLIETLRAGLGPRPFLDLCGRTTLPQLAAVAAESDVFLSNDTGPLHLAAAAGAKVVGIYTCTSPEKTGPYGPRATAIQTGIWCAGSRLKCCSNMECMDELTPARVWGAVRQSLKPARKTGLPVLTTA